MGSENIDANGIEISNLLTIGPETPVINEVLPVWNEGAL